MEYRWNEILFVSFLVYFEVKNKKIKICWRWSMIIFTNIYIENQKKKHINTWNKVLKTYSEVSVAMIGSNSILVQQKRMLNLLIKTSRSIKYRPTPIQRININKVKTSETKHIFESHPIGRLCIWGSRKESDRNN